MDMNLFIKLMENHDVFTVTEKVGKKKTYNS